MDKYNKLDPLEIEEILQKIEAHASKIDFTRGFNIGMLHAVHNSRVRFAQSYINSLKDQELTPSQNERLEELKKKLYIPSE